MTVEYEIQCVTKTDRYNPHERITAVGGTLADQRKWTLSQEDAIAAIEDRRYGFYVRRGGQSVNVIVAKSRFGNKYLKTTADGEHPNNLLSLAECPI